MFPFLAASIIAIGSVISNPEAVTGVWEETSYSQGPPATVGIAITIGTTINGSPSSLRGTTQRVNSLGIATYTRDIERSKRTRWGSSMPGSLDWSGNHLRFHQTSSDTSPFDVDLDLTFDPKKSVWNGSFRNPDFSGNVVLKRPAYYEPRSIVGTWSMGNSDPANLSCVHIGMGTDSQLMIWLDSLTLTGLVHYAQARQTPPPTTTELYGSLMDDPHLRDGGPVWKFDLATGMGGAFIAGTLSDDAATFFGESTRYGNGIYSINGPYARPFTWQRVNDNAC